MKIGVCDRTTSGWSSGAEYTRAQVAALLAVRDELGFEVQVVADTDQREVSIGGVGVPVTRMPPPGEVGPVTRVVDRVKRELGRGVTSQLRAWRAWAAREGFDVLLSFTPPESSGWKPSDVGVGVWLWDFQHDVMPDMFPPARRHYLDAAFRQWAEDADLVVVSSEASRQDFAAFAPDLLGKARIYRFPSRLAFDPALTAATDLHHVLDRYRIEDDFFLVVNQFWQHKNHEAVVEAAGILKRTTGESPQIVMIGLPYDDRDPTGRYLSTLFGKIAEYGLEGRVKILGFVSGQDRDALFRSCTALIQPSRFEGWNTSIEDAKAIGLPVIASGIDVNREHIPEAFGFFDVDRPEALAELLTAAATLPAGPDFGREEAALSAAREKLVATGRELYDICVEIAEAARRRGAVLPVDRG